MKQLLLLFILVSTVQSAAWAQVWKADLGNGKYKNPIIYADYSDPDVCRVGNDFYMTSSSFNCSPSLPILHSTDMVNWELIGYALQRQVPDSVFSKPQHGNGVWAPAIRYHNHEFYIYYPDPDFGIYMIKAKDPKGPWSDPVLVQGGKGWIDPCPFWDDNGKAYLVNAFAGSRAGIKTILIIHEMTPDGTKLIGNGVLVFDGHNGNTTVEGPKLYKRNGYYYIFAPAGGVKPGWQLVMRSKAIFGPYESKVVLHQGNTKFNGPHQGAYIELDNGESWFYHFQDNYAYGRLVLLEPVHWKNDWPIIGIDQNNDGIGEPVAEYKKPNIKNPSPVDPIPSSDEFNGDHYGLQWQWHANPQPTWGFISGNKGYMRLYCVPQKDSLQNLWAVPNLFLQKFPAPDFTATTKFTFNHHLNGDQAGLVIMGETYSYLALKQIDGKLQLRQIECAQARKGKPDQLITSTPIDHSTIYLRVKVSYNAQCNFYYSTDGKKYKKIGNTFTATAGRWIGAKVGLMATSNQVTNDGGYLDVDWFRIEPNK